MHPHLTAASNSSENPPLIPNERSSINIETVFQYLKVGGRTTLLGLLLTSQCVLHIGRAEPYEFEFIICKPSRDSGSYRHMQNVIQFKRLSISEVSDFKVIKNSAIANLPYVDHFDAHSGMGSFHCNFF